MDITRWALSSWEEVRSNAFQPLYVIGAVPSSIDRRALRDAMEFAGFSTEAAPGRPGRLIREDRWPAEPSAASRILDWAELQMLPRSSVTRECACGCGRTFEVPATGVQATRRAATLECRYRLVRDRIGQPRMTVELVPRGQWGANLAQSLKGKRWDRLRQEVLTRAADRCEVCGDPGSTHSLEAHEEWDYDDDLHIQRLSRLVALCRECHEVKHIGRATNIGRGDAARSHLARVNGWSVLEAGAYVAAVQYEWAQRSKCQWELDLSALAEYGVLPPSAEELRKGKMRSDGKR